MQLDPFQGIDVALDIFVVVFLVLGFAVVVHSFLVGPESPKIQCVRMGGSYGEVLAITKEHLDFWGSFVPRNIVKITGCVINGKVYQLKTSWFGDSRWEEVGTVKSLEG